MSYTLMVQHRPTEQGEHRVVFENGKSLAVAIVDTSVPDFTLGWPTLVGAHSPADVLENWLSNLLPGYGIQPYSMTLEYYIGDRFCQHSLSSPVSVEAINAQVKGDMRSPEDEVTFLLLNAQNNVLELSLANSMLVECACTLREVHLRPLIDFFRAYHMNWRVREDVTLSQQIFSTREQLASGLNFLEPVGVFP